MNADDAPSRPDGLAPPDAGRGFGRWLPSAAILVALLAGAWLRLVWLGDRLVIGDEIHSIEALKNSLGHTLTHFQRPDNCIPITAWCKLLALSVGLDEWGLRLLAFVPGILLLVVAARATRTCLSTGERLVLVTLLALSPLLIFWSRTGRPYSAIALLGVLAVLTYLRYGQHRTFRRSLWCALCQFGLLWFSPTTAPALASLALAAAVYGLQQGGPGLQPLARLRSACRLAWPSILAGLLSLALLAPALPSLWELLHYEQHFLPSANIRSWFQFVTLTCGFSMMVSAKEAWLLVPPLALTLVGLVRFCLVQRSLALPACLLLLTSPVLYTLFEFQGLGYGTVLARYQAATIPLFLFLLVYGLGALLRGLQRLSPVLAGAGVAAALVLLVLHAERGPLRTGLGPEAPYGLLYSRMHEPRPLAELAALGQAPEFYAQLAGVDNDVVLYECVGNTKLDRLIALYRELHGGRVIRCRDRALGPALELDFSTFRQRRADLPESLPRGAYVVVHNRPMAERTVFHHRATGTSSRELLGRAKTLAQHCRKLYGEPVYEDWFLVVFGSRETGAPTFESPVGEPPERRAHAPAGR